MKPRAKGEACRNFEASMARAVGVMDDSRKWAQDTCLILKLRLGRGSSGVGEAGSVRSGGIHSPNDLVYRATTGRDAVRLRTFSAERVVRKYFSAETELLKGERRMRPASVMCADSTAFLCWTKD